MKHFSNEVIFKNFARLYLFGFQLLDSSRGLVIGALTMSNSTRLIKNYLMTYVKHTYNYEIVTGLNVNKIEYLRLTHLFDLEVHSIY